MTKKIIKILSFIILLLVLLIVYLSFIGIKTVKFNEIITDKVSQTNKKLKLDLKDIKLLLNPLTFTASIITKDPLIFLGGNKLQIRSIKTNISLNSLIFDEFSLEDLHILTEPVTLNDIILLVRSFKNSTELFLLDKIIKDGFLVADIKIKFDKEGNVKKDYQINGFIKNGNLNFLNQFKANNLNLNFDINKNQYSLTNLSVEINDVKFDSPLIEIKEKKNLFFVKGKILNNERNFSRDELDNIFVSLFNIPSIKKVRFSSENDISFDVNKKFKFNNLSIKSNINIEELIVKNNFINLKSYLPDLDEFINFEKHKITINYNKNKIDIKGEGKILFKKKFDLINYRLLKKNDELIFDTRTNLKNNKLLIDFLNYEKKENLDASILIKGNLKKNKKINLDLVSLVENNNKISFKKLNLQKDFKIISLDSFNFNYLNNKKKRNQLLLKKNNSNYTIEGESFDATKLINKIMDSSDESVSLFSNLNSKINIKIKKTFINSSKIQKDENIKKLIELYGLKYKIIRINKIEVFELQSLNLRKYYHKNILAFGDLLHKIHPLAGQGFNMTLRDIKIFLDIIKSRIDLGLQIDSSINQDFENKLKYKNLIFSSGVDIIHEFFNMERKVTNDILSKSIQFLGKNPLMNRIFSKIADKGI